MYKGLNTYINTDEVSTRFSSLSGVNLRPMNKILWWGTRNSRQLFVIVVSHVVTVKRTTVRYRLGINNHRTRRFCLSNPVSSKLISTQNRYGTSAREWFNARLCHIQIHDTYDILTIHNVLTGTFSICLVFSPSFQINIGTGIKVVNSSPINWQKTFITRGGQKTIFFIPKRDTIFSQLTNILSQSREKIKCTWP